MDTVNQPYRCGKRRASIDLKKKKNRRIINIVRVKFLVVKINKRKKSRNKDLSVSKHIDIRMTKFLEPN